MTRTESTLTVTGSGTNRKGGKAQKGPYEYLELLREKHSDLVSHWDVPATPEEAEALTTLREGTFPSLRANPDALRGADLVLDAMEELPTLRAGETFELWEQEAGAPIEEYAALKAPVVDVELPTELTASDMVSLSSDPIQFARRQRRPVPFKPNAYAKRGTAFHAWLEERFGSPALLSENELPGSDEQPEQDLESLKDAFLNSPWAQRTPEYVEAPLKSPSVSRSSAAEWMPYSVKPTEPGSSWTGRLAVRLPVQRCAPPRSSSPSMQRLGGEYIRRRMYALLSSMSVMVISSNRVICPLERS